MAISIRRLNHVNIGAPSGEEAKARHFYGTILGLKEVPLPSSLTDVYELVWFELLDFLLHIAFSHHFVRPVSSTENGVFMPGRHIAIEVKDIKDFRETMKANAVVIHEAVTMPDRDRFYIEDPFGNIIEIIEFHKDQTGS